MYLFFAQRPSAGEVLREDVLPPRVGCSVCTACDMQHVTVLHEEAGGQLHDLLHSLSATTSLLLRKPCFVAFVRSLICVTSVCSGEDEQLQDLLCFLPNNTNLFALRNGTHCLAG